MGKEPKRKGHPKGCPFLLVWRFFSSFSVLFPKLFLFLQPF